MVDLLRETVIQTIVALDYLSLDLERIVTPPLADVEGQVQRVARELQVYRGRLIASLSTKANRGDQFVKEISASLPLRDPSL